METRLESILERYHIIAKELMNPEVMSDFNKVKKLSKEQSDLKETVEKYEEYKKTKANIEEAKTLIADPELKEMAELELAENTEKFKACKKQAGRKVCILFTGRQSCTHNYRSGEGAYRRIKIVYGKKFRE